MSRPDLFSLAASNAADFPQRLEAKRSSVAPRLAALIEAFATCVDRHGAVCINMSSTKIRFFLANRRYLNPHEVARSKAVTSGRSAEQELRDLQGSYYQRRVAFDRYFVNGESFRYGAVSIGGTGALYYGRFCVIFRQDALDTWQSAFLPGNSLELYVPPSAKVDIIMIQRDVAPASEKHRLAALKHADELDGKQDDQWPRMLCSDDSFVEAIFTGDAVPALVQEIRVPAEDARRLYKMALGGFRGGLHDADKAEAQAFVEILDMLESMGMKSMLKEV